MNVFVVLVVLLPLVTSAKDVNSLLHDRLHSPGSLNANQTVKLGIKYLKDLVAVSQTPSMDNIFKMTPQLGPLPIMIGLANIADIIGALAPIFLPDEDKEEARRQYNRLLHELLNVRADIRRLEAQIEWANKQLQYSHVVSVITTATNLASKIHTSRSPAEKLRRQDRFREHCQNQGLQMSLDVLYNGLTGKGLFQSNILASYYRVSRGHRPNMIKLAGRLLQLMSGGLTSLMAYETLVRGQGASEDMARDYQPHMVSTRTATEDNIHRCTREYLTNMNADLTDYLTRNGPQANHLVARGLYDLMTNKFTWVTFGTLVYNKRRSYKDYDHVVSHVYKRLHYPPAAQKNTFLFFYNKGAPFVGRSRVGAAQHVLNYDHYDTKTCFRRVRGRLGNARVPFIGLVVVLQRRGNIHSVGTMEGRLLRASSRRQYKIALLR